MIGLVICIAIMMFLRFTLIGKHISALIRFRYLKFRYETFPSWVKANKDSWYLTTLEKANWFPWYGRKLVYVKAKDVSKLTVTERDVKEAIDAKDYTKAMSIVEQLPDTPKTVRLKQVIQAKL